MKNTNALTRSTAFWLLVLLSLALTGLGGWFVTNEVASMTSRLLDGTATNVDVYVGQSLVVLGAAVLGAGLLGLLLSLVLGVVKTLLPATTVATQVEPQDDTDAPDSAEDTTPADATAVDDAETVRADADTDAVTAEREPATAR